jgi:hypothetical protein
LSALTTRTVRPGTMDSPQGPRGQSGQEPRTVRKSQQNHQRRTRKNGLSARTRRTVRTGSGPSAIEARTVRKPAATKTLNKTESKMKASKNTMNTRRTGLNRHLADGPPGTRGLSAPHGQRQKTAGPRESTPPTHHRISQAVEADETRLWGQDMRQTRMLYPKKFAS